VNSPPRRGALPQIEREERECHTDAQKAQNIGYEFAPFVLLVVSLVFLK
jgi:hypothetical protein